MSIIPFEHVISLGELLKKYLHRRTKMKLSIDEGMHCQTVCNFHEHIFKLKLGHLIK